MEEYEVIHRPERNRFELKKNGMTASVEYEVGNGTLNIMHTTVPPPLEGKRTAAALVEATYRYTAGQGLKPKATCSYAVAWLKRHPVERTMPLPIQQEMRQTPLH